MLKVKMDYYAIYLFQSYYNPTILSDDREKYRTDDVFKEIWDKTNSLYDNKNPSNNKKNVWLTLEDNKVNKLQELIIGNFGQEAIDSFRTTFENEQQHLLSMKNNNYWNNYWNNYQQ
jgi:hypothetical protein